MLDRVVPRALAGAAVVGVLVAFVWALSRPAEVIVGSNHVAPSTFVVDVKPGHEVCDQLGYSSRPADAVRATIGTYKARAQPLTLTVDGATTAFSTYRQGVVDIPLPSGHARGGDRACLRNDGSSRIAVAGTGLAPPAQLDGKDLGAKISLALADHDPPSWGSRMDDVMDHIDRATGAPLGGITSWLLLVLFAGLLGVLGFSVARWAR